MRKSTNTTDLSILSLNTYACIYVCMKFSVISFSLSLLFFPSSPFSHSLVRSPFPFGTSPKILPNISESIYVHRLTHTLQGCATSSDDYICVNVLIHVCVRVCVQISEIQDDHNLILPRIFHFMYIENIHHVIIEFFSSSRHCYVSLIFILLIKIK